MGEKVSHGTRDQRGYQLAEIGEMHAAVQTNSLLRMETLLQSGA